MLSDVMKYSQLFTKLNAMRRILLTREDYEHIVQTGSVKEIGRILKDSEDYRHVLHDLSDEDMRREPIEKKLMYMFYDDYARIFNYVLNTNERKYLKVYFKIYEVNALRWLLRGVMSNRISKVDVSDMEGYVRRHMAIDIVKLSSSTNLDEFIENLEGSPYQSIINDIKKNNPNPSLFQMETQFELNYFLQLWKSQNRFLSKKTRESQKEINGIDIDMRNMISIYRAKKYFTVENAIIYTYLIPIHYKLKKDDISAMVESESIAEFWEVLLKTPYGKILPRHGLDIQTSVKDLSLMDLDRCYFRVMRYINRKAEKQHPYSIAKVTSYMQARYQEIKNLTSVIEGVRYTLKPEDVLSHVTFVRESESGGVVT